MCDTYDLKNTYRRNKDDFSARNTQNKYTDLSIGLMNARSLDLKLPSFYETFEDSELSLACVCETWLKSDGNFNRIKEDLKERKNLDIYAYNRPGKRRGGGVSIIVDPTKIKVSENKFKRDSYEIVSVIGKIIGGNRPLIVYCVYLPPNLTVARAQAASALITSKCQRLAGTG